MTWEIPLFNIYYDDEDIKSVENVLRRGSYWAMGPEIEEFEQRISEYLGMRYALTFNSGTSALHALLLAYGIGEGDEVIVPSFTFISTANAALFTKARPVFAEIEDKTLGLDPEDIKERITSKTKAIIPIHYGGGPCLINEIKEIADDYNLLLIEDAAESLGAKINGKFVGTFGNSSVLSFCQNKIITTGEGGAIVTDSKKIFEKLKLIRSHGRLDTSNYFSSADVMDYVNIGYNFRMSSITAALGLSQIKKISKIIDMRRAIADVMSQNLASIRGINMIIPHPNRFHVYQMYTIMIDKYIRNDLIKNLSQMGIMTKIYFPPVHLTNYYAKSFDYKPGDLPVTEEIAGSVLSLPIYPKLAEDKIAYIINCLRNFMESRT